MKPGTSPLDGKNLHVFPNPVMSLNNGTRGSVGAFVRTRWVSQPRLSIKTTLPPPVRIPACLHFTPAVGAFVRTRRLPPRPLRNSQITENQTVAPTSPIPHSPLRTPRSAFPPLFPKFRKIFLRSRLRRGFLFTKPVNPQNSCVWKFPATKAKQTTSTTKYLDQTNPSENPKSQIPILS